MNITEAQEIGKIFRDARKKKGMSIEEATRRSRIHMNVIDDIENGVFNRLGKLYIKSFLKKYAEFLDLDTEKILEKYETVAAEYPTIEFDPDIQQKEERKRLPKKSSFVISEKMIQGMVAGVLSLALISLVFVLVGRIKTKVSSRGKTETMMAAREKKVPVSAEARKPASPVPPKKEEVKAPPKSSQVKLTLTARGEAWVKVMKGDETLYVGVIRKGSSKSWTSDTPLTIWTGRGEMLDFTVNNQRIGKVAEGVVKNIKVSNAGVTIDDNWVTRF
ncbi:MAG: RodZ domain-containing protein [Candidatus Omnitrophota bacterium]